MKTKCPGFGETRAFLIGFELKKGSAPFYVES